VLFTDVVIPGAVTGIALCDQLRKERPTLAVILCSGYSLESSKLKAAMGAGVTFLGKPFGTTKMLAAVRSALQAQSRTTRFVAELARTAEDGQRHSP
jgi:FixJ family two-component response regulator